jgi:serine/threonine protein kinase
MPPTGIALPPGSTLQEYRIVSTLGVGGFGVTYLAVDTNLNLNVAIKEYLPGDLAVRGEDRALHLRAEASRKTFDWGLRRFLDESRTLASFRHPSIVRVMRFFEAQNTAYMVMEFVEGRTLQDWVKRRRPLPETVVLALLGPLLDGLEVIHGAGYLHRDIKPNNIFIREDGSPVLLDFGSARAAGAESELTVIVSPGYAPLEQYHAHGNQGPWSDLYALGGVLYWMVTGSHPLEAPARARRDALPPALQLGERTLYRAGLLKAIDWALAPAEEDRPQSVAAFREALLSIDPDPASEVATFLAGSASAFVETPPSAPPSGEPIDAETLKKITSGLASHLGPIAGVVVKSALKRAASASQLVEEVSREIADEGARAAFLKACAKEVASGPASRPPSSRPPASRPASGSSSPNPPPSQPGSRPSSAGASSPGLDAEALARAEADLARHLGAVARILVRRLAPRAQDEPELYRLLAEEIDDPAARQAFLGKGPRRSGRP